ncbi:MAG: CoA-binding protein [Methanophagales archaeon]|nr:CoA-binding protein [Methanophagales archaeon]
MSTDLIKDFLRKQNVFAVVGVSRDPAKYGHQVYKDLKEAGYAVYAVNPNIDEVLGDRCYHSLGELPERPDVVDTVVPPAVTEEVVEECKELGVERVWMQPGSESERAINFCTRNRIKVVQNVCVMVKRKAARDGEEESGSSEQNRNPLNTQTTKVQKRGKRKGRWKS